MSEAGTHGFTAARRRDAGRAAVVCGVWLGGILGLQVARNDARPSTLAVAFVVWGVAGALAGAGAVYAGGAWRAANGRWHVAPAFAALVVGTPVASLAGMMLGGEPYGRSAIRAGLAWAAAVGVAWMTSRLRRRFA